MASSLTRTQSGSQQPKPPATGSAQPTHDENGILALSYEETIPAKPPTPVTVAPPRVLPEEQHPALRRPLTSDGEKDETKRDSGLAPTTSTAAQDGSANPAKEEALGLSINVDSNSKDAQARLTTPMQSPPQTPKMIKSESWGSGSMSIFKRPMSRRPETPKTPKSAGSSTQEFFPILTPIPTESLMDTEFLSQMSFSKRGSMMLGGKKAVNGKARQVGKRRYAGGMRCSSRYH